MQLTKNFNTKEFNQYNTRLIPVVYRKNMLIMALYLQVIRDYVNEPIKINSAYRDMRSNKKAGGVANSAHLECLAVDIKCKGLTSYQLFEKINELSKKAYLPHLKMIRYNTHLHISFDIIVKMVELE